ncbi:MAG: UDP-glucose 6-dehydrogenase, partial [Anaerolineae bacterium]|nr:UDP-glucose 6-dehydrogenase [Anaerolineae bacterium]
RPLMPQVEMKEDTYSLAENADALIVVTEWNEFLQVDLARLHDSMKTPVIVDGRNIYDPVMMKEIGFNYRGVGRGFRGKAKEYIEVNL